MRPDETHEIDEGEEERTPISSEPEVDSQSKDPSTTEITAAASRSLEILNIDDYEDDEDYDEDEEFDDDENDVRTILITGASTDLGRKLRAAWGDLYDLILIDGESDLADNEVMPADLAEMDESWLSHFHRVDTVIHIDADQEPNASWEDLEKPSIDVACNVFNAAALAGVERVIFASSHHVMAGYRVLTDMPITTQLPPKPEHPLGIVKLLCERVGKSLGDAFDITFIALRLGYVQPGENRCDTLPDDWTRAMWLSNDDMARLFECAVEAELGDRLFAVFNGMSNNRGMRWDLSDALDHLGYSPEDDAYAEEI